MNAFTHYPAVGDWKDLGNVQAFFESLPEVLEKKRIRKVQEALDLAASQFPDETFFDNGPVPRVYLAMRYVSNPAVPVDDDVEIAGFLLAEFTKEGRTDIKDIYIHPDCRRLGCGRSVLDFMVTDAGLHDQKDIQLFVSDGAAAETFFRACGFGGELRSGGFSALRRGLVDAVASTLGADAGTDSVRCSRRKMVLAFPVNRIG